MVNPSQGQNYVLEYLERMHRHLNDHEYAELERVVISALIRAQEEINDFELAITRIRIVPSNYIYHPRVPSSVFNFN